MAVENLDLPAPNTVAPVTIPADFVAKKLAKDLSTDELVQRCGSISAQARRAFAGRTDYESVEDLDAALKEADRGLPTVSSVYKPSGKTTVSATIFILLSAPIMLMVMLAVCGGLSWGWLKFELLFSAETQQNNSRIFGMFSLVVDLVLMTLIVVIPTGCYAPLSRWFKNRNPVLPAFLTAVIAFTASLFIFAPVWKGQSLAPVHVSFALIPLRWIFVFLGCVLVPLIGALVVATQIVNQKFCEETGHYLKRFSEIRIPFDFAENALALLRRGEYAALARLPRATDLETKQKHNGCIVLWWHEQAAAAFLELDLQFFGKYPIQVGVSKGERAKPKPWRSFSTRLNAAQALALANDWKQVVAGAIRA
jgi:hypothetical protein